MPDFDPPTFASRVLQQLDKSSDGAITKAEAEKIPGIANRWERYDLDSNGSISTQELEQRAGKWADRAVSLAIVSGYVQLNRRNVGDVTVKLIPEDVLAGVILPAETTSDAARPSYFHVTGDSAGAANENRRGMQYGLYRLEVSHPTMRLEVAPQSRGIDIGREDEIDGIVLHVQPKQ